MHDGFYTFSAVDIVSLSLTPPRSDLDTSRRQPFTVYGLQIRYYNLCRRYLDRSAPPVDCRGASAGGMLEYSPHRKVVLKTTRPELGQFALKSRRLKYNSPSDQFAHMITRLSPNPPPPKLTIHLWSYTIIISWC